MPKIIENFFENNVFIFRSYACNCAEDTFHVATDIPAKKTCKIQAYADKPLLFGYMGKTGLARIAKNGTIAESNILGSLIALPDKKTSELYSFFERNGFLFPISQTAYESIDIDTLYALIRHIKATVELMTAVNEIKKDYGKILHLTLYLLLSESVSVQFESLPVPYTTCRHPFMDVLEKANLMQLSKARQQESFDKYTFAVNDTIYPPTYEFDINEYNDTVSGSSLQGNICTTPFYQQIVQLYVNYDGSEVERQIIDFLFHLQHEIGIVFSFNMKDGLTLADTATHMEISDSMKSTLISIAKVVLGEEINANLQGIYPKYDIQAMSPSWKVDSLLSAVYFSIFYLKPDLELYRPCANPRCGRYFLVKTTSTNTKYCSTECCNRVTQDRYRKRKREREQK